MVLSQDSQYGLCDVLFTTTFADAQRRTTDNVSVFTYYYTAMY